jgi:hypothetical protein
MLLYNILAFDPKREEKRGGREKVFQNFNQKMQWKKNLVIDRIS